MNSLKKTSGNEGQALELNPTTAGSHSTIPEQHRSDSTIDTSASVAGTSKQDHVKKVNEQKVSIERKNVDIQEFYQLPTGHIPRDELTKYIRKIKQQEADWQQEKTSFEEIEKLILELAQNSPLDLLHMELDFEAVFKELQIYTEEYQTSIAELFKSLQNLDDSRNQWLESTYILDDARTTNNFNNLKDIIHQHEKYIELAKSDFLESLNSIRMILGLDSTTA